MSNNNVTIGARRACWVTLVVGSALICATPAGTGDLDHLVGSTGSGEAFFFARNDIPGESELTGPTFSNDKKILAANVQSPGHVFAIRGPFRRQR